ncbi:MAG: tRNA threonylcarbamoyladenosine dehydratase [Clostridia bacterium]|nr:tRNA threonylcarbamoyladenosine dehydratase [Clostridia bacterium]
MIIREEDTRTAAVIGGGACDKLKKARVAVFGVGGVGGNAVEALARAGVGRIDIFDGDTVNLSNINRQIIALHSTVGKSKVEVMRQRILDINPDCDVRVKQVFYLPENADEIDLSHYNYIVDAVDTVAAKLELAVRTQSCGVPMIAAMGAGNKLDPTAFTVSDIYKTDTCALARVMRRELKARGIKHLKVVWSRELSVKTEGGVVGSMPHVPGVAGYIIAGEVIKDLIKE